MAQPTALTPRQQEDLATEKQRRLASYITRHFPGAVPLSLHAEEAAILKQIQTLCDLWQKQLVQTSMRNRPPVELAADEVFVHHHAPNSQQAETSAYWRTFSAAQADEHRFSHEIIVPALLESVFHVGADSSLAGIVRSGWAAAPNPTDDQLRQGVYDIACPALVYTTQNPYGDRTSLGPKPVTDWALGRLSGGLRWMLRSQDLPNKPDYTAMRNEGCSWQYEMYLSADYLHKPPTQAKWVRRDEHTQRTFIFDANLTRALHEHEQRIPHICLPRQ
ncbi:hypothetical protein JCM10296v2_003930 [Rhodotorula toruloides]